MGRANNAFNGLSLAKRAEKAKYRGDADADQKQVARLGVANRLIPVKQIAVGQERNRLKPEKELERRKVLRPDSCEVGNRQFAGVTHEDAQRAPKARIIRKNRRSGLMEQAEDARRNEAGALTALRTKL